MENESKEIDLKGDQVDPVFERWVSIIIFNEDATKVLMFWDSKRKIYDFISAKVEARDELSIESTYRVLIERTGIADIELELVQHELTKHHMRRFINLFVTTGRLKNGIKAEEVDHELLWIDVNDYDNIINTGYDGSNIVYLERAKRVLGLETKLKSHIL